MHTGIKINMNNSIKFLFLLSVIAMSACSNKDYNSQPIYGKESGLPANCRAYIQVAVNQWRNGAYDARVSMDAIERNCGANGSLWDYKP